MLACSEIQLTVSWENIRACLIITAIQELIRRPEKQIRLTGMSEIRSYILNTIILWNTSESISYTPHRDFPDHYAHVQFKVTDLWLHVEVNVKEQITQNIYQNILVSFQAWMLLFFIWNKKSFFIRILLLFQSVFRFSDCMQNENWHFHCKKQFYWIFWGEGGGLLIFPIK